MIIKKGFIEISEDECRLIVDDRFLLVNFPVKKSIRLYSLYDKIKNKEKENLTIELKSLVEFSEDELFLFEGKEAFERCLIVTYFLLKKHDIIMISDVGLSDESIKKFKIIMEKIMKILHYKSLYFVRKNYEFIDHGEWFKEIEKLALETKNPAR